MFTAFIFLLAIIFTGVFITQEYPRKVDKPIEDNSCYFVIACLLWAWLFFLLH